MASKKCWICEGRWGSLSKLELEKGAVHEFCRYQRKHPKSNLIRTK